MASRYRTLASICLAVLCVAAGEASIKEFDPASSCRTGDASRITGIGLDLTTSYAAAAIRNPDGTVDNLMKVCKRQRSIMSPIQNLKTRLTSIPHVARLDQCG